MLDIRHVMAFRTVMECRSMSRAAERLGISQPAVSGLIQRFERETGFALFVRAQGAIEPTAEGHLLFANTEPALQGFERLDRAVEDIRLKRTGSLVIATHPLASVSLLPPVVGAFLRERPGVSVRIATRSSRLVRELIPSAAFDVAIAELPIEKGMARATRVRVASVCVMAADHPLAARAVITPRLLGGHGVATLYREHVINAELRRACDRAGAAPDIRVETEFAATACALALFGAMIAVVDPFTAEDYAARGAVIRRFAPRLPYEFAIYHPARGPMSGLARDFIAALRRHVARYQADR